MRKICFMISASFSFSVYIKQEAEIASSPYIINIDHNNV